MAVSSQRLQNLLESLAEPICRAHGVELVEVRMLRGRGRTTVRVLIDRERADGLPGSGVSLQDCTAVTRDLSSALDMHEEELPESYELEVGSPGLERPLVKPADYERFAGREIKLRTRDRIDGRRNFTGRLEGLADGRVRLADAEGERAIPLEQVERAHLVHRFRDGE